MSKTERDRGNLAFAVVSSQVHGRVQMERLRQAFENCMADISQTLIRGPRLDRDSAGRRLTGRVRGAEERTCSKSIQGIVFCPLQILSDFPAGLYLNVVSVWPHT